MILFIILNFITLTLLSLVFSSISILVIGSIGLLILLYFSKNENQKLFNRLSLIFLISIFLMIVLYCGYISKYGAPYYIGGSDDLSFENYGKYAINQKYYRPEQLLQESQFRFYSANGFVWIMSWIIRLSNILGGYHTITYRVLNIYFNMILGMLVFKYFSNHYDFSEKENLIVLYAITLFPNSLYISIHVFRDTLNILILFGIFYLWDIYISKQRKKYERLLIILITLILTYISYWLRSQNLIFIFIIIVLNIFLKDQKLTSRNSIYFLIAIIFGVASYNYLGVGKQLEYFTGYYTEYILNLSEGFSKIIFSVNLFPFGILLRIAYGLVSPLPVHILHVFKMFEDVDVFFQVIISIGVIVQIYLLPYLFRNIKYIDKVTLIFWIFFVAMVITTFTFRHFISIYPFMVILIFREFFKASKKRKIVSGIFMTWILVLGASMYLLIK